MKPDKVRRCRYCGIRGDRTTLRYERGLMGEAKYDCRDTAACGQRIRESRKPPEVLNRIADNAALLEIFWSC